LSRQASRIAAAHLQAVTGIEQEGDLGPFEQCREAAKGLAHRRVVGVDDVDDLEIEAFQRLGDVVGVVGGIGELRGIGVGAIADHEGDPLTRRSHAGGNELGEQHGADERACRAHGPSPPLPTEAPDGRRSWRGRAVPPRVAEPVVTDCDTVHGVGSILAEVRLIRDHERARGGRVPGVAPGTRLALWASRTRERPRRAPD
jgi:hypothetical protein